MITISFIDATLGLIVQSLVVVAVFGAFFVLAALVFDELRRRPALQCVRFAADMECEQGQSRLRHAVAKESMFSGEGMAEVANSAGREAA